MIINFFKHISFRLKMPSQGIVENWRCCFTPEDLLKRTDEVIESTRKLIETSMLSVPDSEVNSNNVLQVLDAAVRQLKTKGYILSQIHNFVVEENLRDASRKADKKLKEFSVEMSMNKDIFKKLIHLQQKNEVLAPELKYTLEKLILEGKRNGLNLPEKIQNEVKELKTKINDLSVQFISNIGEDSTTLEFSYDELFGVPQDLIDSLEKLESGKLKVNLKYPHYCPIMQKCRNPETRKSMHTAFSSRCKSTNKPILNEIIKLRQKHANLLGYPNHAAFVTETQMSKSADSVKNFLEEIEQKMQPLWKKEQKCMLQFKEKECRDLGLPFDNKLYLHDLTFYCTKIEEVQYSIDQNKVKEYFPLPTVTKGLFEIYQTLLGLKFTEIENPEVWHEDVQQFKVEDAATEALLGYFFLDMFPREGKYSHAAVSELQTSCLTPSGRQVAVAAMLTNFSKPQKDKPSFLESSEVQTLFHEFGHLMHYICAQNNLAHSEAFRCERDFIEAPSQMLENWCFEKEPLRKMSGHYSTMEAIPELLLSDLKKSQLANIGFKTLRQIVFSLLDFKIHSSQAECDADDVYAKTFKNIIGIDVTEGTSMTSSFSHICDEYDSRYYGYLWSEVYSADMFETCFKGSKIMDPEAGRNYRKKILEHGSSKPAMDMLVDFLGRQPSPDAYFRSKGF